MSNDASSSETPRSHRERFRSWAGGLALIFGAVIMAFLIAELGPVRELCASIDAAREIHLWLIGIPIGLMVAGGILMLGAQLLPGPRQETPPPDEALDGAAVPLDYAEERGRWSRSMEMEASTGQVREAWRRRSWRYSRRWQVFFLMMLGAVLLSAGIIALFILIGAAYAKVLVLCMAVYLVARIAWQFAVG